MAALTRDRSKSKRWQERLKCPVCRKPFVPYRGNGQPRKTCSNKCGQTLRRSRPGQYNTKPVRVQEPPPQALRAKTSRVREIILDMPKEDRVHYEVEGCMPLSESIAATGWVDEDMDATPVPTGCPECWRTGGPYGACCDNCPSPISRKEINRLCAETDKAVAL